MSPRRNLNRRKTQAPKLARHAIHSEFRIDQHVRLSLKDGVHPFPQAFRTLLEMRCMRPRKMSLPVLRSAEVENVHVEPAAIEVPDPALDERAPDGVLIDVRQYDADPDTAPIGWRRSEEHTSELQSRLHLVCRLLL